MARSGSTDFTLTRDDIIEAALIKCRAHRVGQSIPGSLTAQAAKELNRLVKSWMADGLHLWRQVEAVLFLTADQKKYSLSSTGDRASTTYVDTNLNGALSASDTAVTTDTTTGMTAADNIGIELSDGTMHWDTIASVDSSTTLTLTTGVSGAASDDAQVYTFTSKLTRPLRVLEARRVVDDVEVDIDIVSRDEYMELPNKGTSGKPNLVYYQPELDQTQLYIWPTSDSAVDLIKMTVETPFEDFDTASNNPDFPIEWGNALVYGLAANLADDFGLPMDRIARLESKAADLKSRVMGFDREAGSIFFGVQ